VRSRYELTNGSPSVDRVAEVGSTVFAP
jgi:hypothetical protein